MQKTNQKEFRIEKVIKTKYMSNGKDMITHLIVGLIKRTLYKISQYFPRYSCFEGNVKVELDLSSYATKTDLKNVTDVDVSNFELKSTLASLKTELIN